jgi:hypothetical protein
MTPDIQWIVKKAIQKNPGEPAIMLIAALTAICIGSVGFYVRFLVALCKEWKAQWITYWVGLEPESDTYNIYEEQPDDHSLPRAA